MKRLRYILYLLTLAGMFFSCQSKEQEPTIEDWTRAHTGDSDFLAQARSKIDSVGVATPDSLEHFVRRIADVLCQSGKENLAVSVAAYPHGIDLSADDYSEIGRRLLTQLQLKNNPAPALPFSRRTDEKGTIVLFYESDCGSCQVLLKELRAASDSLQNKGIRIVSLAGDSDPERYKTFEKSLPWADKYCDYRSFQGKYFNSWGVAYTPTMYYINRYGIVQGRYHGLKEIEP